MHVDAATRLGGLPDPDRYLDNVLVFADPGRGGQAQPGPAALWQHWWRRRVTADEPVATAARQGFVLTTAQLDHLGVTRATARHAVATGRWSVPFRGTVAVVDVRDGTDKYAILRRSHALHAAGATLRRPDRTVSGRSAAILHALPTLIVPELAEMTTPDAAGLGTLSVHTFGAALTARDVARWFGVPVTDVARSLVDLARHDRRDGLMAGDAALREKLVRPAELAAALDQAVGWPGVRQEREVLALASPKAESPLESLTRLAMHDSGFPTPQLQVEICGYQVDLFLAGQRLVIEADGRAKYTGDELWREPTTAPSPSLRSLGGAPQRPERWGR